LNLELVTAVAEHLAKGWSPEKCLQYLGLAEYVSGLLRLRRAAVLLFAKDVKHWHPRCQVRVVRVPGTELKTGKEYIVKSDETASGNIMELMNVAWEKLRPHLVETKLTQGAVFREHIMYPEDACREALTNAIAHRDYSIEGQGIEILIFDDRMEVRSPGALLSTIKQVELMKLQGVHESRNALIARVLRELGYMREMGEGLRRIFFLMRDADLVPPELHSEPSGFSIILRYKSVFSEEDQRWLEGYKPLNLAREEMFIALLGKDGILISPQQIYDRLNLVDWDIYRSVITQAQIKGLLYNVLTEREKKSQAKAKKISQREVPRLTVRDSGECEKALSELFTALQATGATPLFSYSYASGVLSSLSAQNLYKTNTGRITKLLQLIGLLDENKSPTMLMQSLWGEQAAKSIRPTWQRVSPPPLAVARKSAVPGSAKTLFVGNVDYDATNDELQSFLSQFGTVVSVSIPKDFVTKRGRGFGFVTTSTREEAENLRQKANGRLFRGRPVRFDWASYG
jgi:ATP-dependent DNA helicase RecG